MNIACQNKLLLKKIICSRVATFSLMSCSPAPDRPMCSSHSDFTPHLPCAQHEGLVPAVTSTVKPHHTNPLQWGRLYKWSLSKTEQSFSDLEKSVCFLILVSLQQCKSGAHHWSQQLYLSGPAEVAWEQHQPSRPGPPEHFSLQLKVCSEMPQCLQVGFWPDLCTSGQQDQVLKTAVKMHFIVC